MGTRETGFKNESDLSCHRPEFAKYVWRTRLETTNQWKGGEAARFLSEREPKEIGTAMYFLKSCPAMSLFLQEACGPAAKWY